MTTVAQATAYLAAHGITPERVAAWDPSKFVPMTPAPTNDAPCACAHHSDGSTTTSLCPVHADADPCATLANVTGRRRRGTIRRGTCTACGWSA